MSDISTDQQQVLYLIKTDADQARYFFAGAKSLKWFLPLKEEGYFNPDTIQSDPDGHAVFWNVLDYLERVSEQVAENHEYGKELLEIIKNIVEFSENKRRIDNYHVWWYCVKIVKNIPFSIIKEHLSVDRFCTWLSVWTNRSMVADLGIVDIGIKLLPKFLEDSAAVDNKYEYAEAIIDAVTETKMRDVSDTSRSGQNVILGLDLYWIREIFDKCHELIGLKCSPEVLLGLAGKLKTALEYKQQSGYANIEIGHDVYQIKVIRVPIEGLKDGGIRFFDDRYKCLVQKFSEGQVKDVEEAQYLRLVDIEPQDELKRFDFTAAGTGAFVSEIVKELPPDIDWTTANELEKALEDVFDSLYSDYTYVWCKSLKDGPEYRDDAQAVLTVVLRDVLLAKCEAHHGEGKIILKILLSDRYRFPIFRRLVLLCVDKYWPDYSDLLEEFFELVPTALEESDFEVELHDLLRNHNLDLSPSLGTKVKELIGRVPEYYVNKGEKQSAYWQYLWLSPLRDNPDFSSLYREANKKAELKDDRPYEPERSTIKGGFVDHVSPISKDDVLRKPIDELVKYLNDFKGADFWQATFDGKPDRQGLARVLRDAVKDNPGKFTDDIDAFCEVKDHSNIHSVLWGFRDAWKDNQELDWEKILNFASKYLSRDKASILGEASQSEGEDYGEGKYIWIVDEITSLIADGCKNDERAFNPEYFDTVEQVFELILPLLKPEKHPDAEREALMYALNTTVGRTIMSYISFSRRVARVKKQAEEGWGAKKYERFFNMGVEASIWFGCYLSSIWNLDRQYTTEKIKVFEQKALDDFEWQRFMEGYLEGSQVDTDVYRLMRQNYLKAIENAAFQKRAGERLVQHICLGYLYFSELLAPNNDDGQESLFWKMLTQAEGLNRSNRWLQVPSFFWVVAGRVVANGQQDAPKRIREKILEFWSWTYDQRDFVERTLADGYGSFLTRMAKLTDLLDAIDETSEKWLLLCAPNVGNISDAMFFVEYLAKFDDEESVKRIGKLFLKVLESVTPTMRQEDIISIVRRIYEKGDHNDFRAICDTYARRGVHFLRPVWEAYQKKTR